MVQWLTRFPTIRHHKNQPFIGLLACRMVWACARCKPGVDSVWTQGLRDSARAGPSGHLGDSAGRSGAIGAGGTLLRPPRDRRGLRHSCRHSAPRPAPGRSEGQLASAGVVEGPSARVRAHARTGYRCRQLSGRAVSNHLAPRASDACCRCRLLRCADQRRAAPARAGR